MGGSYLALGNIRGPRRTGWSCPVFILASLIRAISIECSAAGDPSIENASGSISGRSRKVLALWWRSSRYSGSLGFSWGGSSGAICCRSWYLRCREFRDWLRLTERHFRKMRNLLACKYLHNLYDYIS